MKTLISWITLISFTLISDAVIPTSPIEAPHLTSIETDSLRSAIDSFQVVTFSNGYPDNLKFYEGVERHCIQRKFMSPLSLPYKYDIKGDSLMITYMRGNNLVLSIYDMSMRGIHEYFEVPVNSKEIMHYSLSPHPLDQNSTILIDKFLGNITLYSTNDNSVIKKLDFPDQAIEVITDRYGGGYFSYQKVDTTKYIINRHNENLDIEWSIDIPFEMGRTTMFLSQDNNLRFSSSGEDVFRPNGAHSLYVIDRYGQSASKIVEAPETIPGEYHEQHAIYNCPILEFGVGDNLYWYTRILQGKYYTVLGDLSERNKEYLIQNAIIESGAPEFEYDFIYSIPRGIIGNEFISLFTQREYDQILSEMHDPSKLHAYWKENKDCTMALIRYKINFEYLDELTKTVAYRSH